MGVEDAAKRRYADIAQLAEHPPCKREVTSSILVVGSTGHTLRPSQRVIVNNVIRMGGYPSGQRGLTVNQLSDDFGGSNPSPPTCTGKFLALYRGVLGQHVAPS